MLSDLDNSTLLISNVLKGGRDVNFFAAFGEPIQNHVDEDISSGATDSVAAVQCTTIKKKISHFGTSAIVIFLNGESSSTMHKLDLRLIKTF